MKFISLPAITVRAAVACALAACWFAAMPATRGWTAEGSQENGPAAEAEKAELRVRIIDAGTRELAACTVRLVDSEGGSVTEGQGIRDGFRSSGVFTKQLSAGLVKLRVERGPEYKAVEREISLRPGETNLVEIVLVRQVDLRRRGWFSGDSHAHMLHGERTLPVDFDQVALAAQAEDLQYLSLGQMWSLDHPTPERLTAELGRRSRPDCVLTWNLEAPKNYYKGDAGRCLGHCWNLGMRGRTAAGDDVIAMLLEASAGDYENEKPSYANFESHALIHAQGGSVFYTHPARWWTGEWGGQGVYPRQQRMRVSNMAVELPLDVLAGPTFDGLDVITSGGEVAANQKAFQLWALLLNRGYRLAATASSDACFDRPGGAVPGSARLYTFIDGPFTLGAASRAAAQGRTFATTGPLLLVSVDNQPPGTAFPTSGQSRTLRIDAWSSGAVTGGLARIEVLRNGEVIQQHVLDGRPTSMSTNMQIAESEAAWYCVRAFGANEQRQRAVSGAFFFDPTPWRAPEAVKARIRARVIAAGTGQSMDATLTEVTYVGTRARAGTTYKISGGSTEIEIPATARLRAEAPGFAPVTLSPFFDHPALVEFITRMEDKDLLDWGTYERVRELLRNVELEFKLPEQADR